MSQHNIKAPRIDVWNLGGKIGNFLLIFDQFLVLETKIWYGANRTDRTPCGAPVKATELNFQDFGGQNLLFFAYF